MEYFDALSLELARSSSAAPQSRFSIRLLFAVMLSSVLFLVQLARLVLIPAPASTICTPAWSQ